MNYGRAIKAIRAAKSLEQRDLAARAKLDPSYISLIESNRRVPSSGALEAIALALQTPLYLLMLLASDESDLHGVSKEDAQLLGAQLLDVLLQADSAKVRYKQRRR